MIPPQRRLSEVRKLIQGEYFFTIHGARQSGKTTLLNNLSEQLNMEGQYAALTISLESVVDDRPEVSIPQICEQIRHRARWSLPELLRPSASLSSDVGPQIALKSFLTEWSHECSNR
jgi:AAA+ ATPase superfamily predicted ATPase